MTYSIVAKMFCEGWDLKSKSSVFTGGQVGVKVGVTSLSSWCLEMLGGRTSLMLLTLSKGCKIYLKG